jgi:hypothetical protein
MTMRKTILQSLAMLLAAMVMTQLQAQMVPATPVAEKALSTEQREIYELEMRWGQAFLGDDYEFIERIVAPEFRLVLHEDAPFVVPREPWMANTRRWDFASFPIEVFDIVVTGDTAVAVVKGSWQVDADGQRIIDNEFFLTDTWVRRDDQWQVIRRHSQNLD